jgi:hypothetical protein
MKCSVGTRVNKSREEPKGFHSCRDVNGSKRPCGEQFGLGDEKCCALVKI